MKFKTRIMTFAFTSMMILSALQTSHAFDQKVFAGSVCQPVTTQISGTFLIYSDTRVVNSTLDSQRNTAGLTCPITRDTETNKTWRSISVRVRDNSAIEGVTCSVTISAPIGDVRSTLTEKLDVPASFVGDHVLFFRRPATNFASGPISVHCRLPGNVDRASSFSAIYSIQLTEEE